MFAQAQTMTKTNAITSEPKNNSRCRQDSAKSQVQYWPYSSSSMDLFLILLLLLLHGPIQYPPHQYPPWTNSSSSSSSSFSSSSSSSQRQISIGPAQALVGVQQEPFMGPSAMNGSRRVVAAMATTGPWLLVGSVEVDICESAAHKILSRNANESLLLERRVLRAKRRCRSRPPPPPPPPLLPWTSSSSSSFSFSMDLIVLLLLLLLLFF